MPIVLLVLFVLLVVYPISEYYLMSYLASLAGSGWVWVWVGLTLLLGVALFRYHKLALAATLLRDARSGTLGLGSMLALLRYYLAAVLLILPGVGGDVLGLLLLLPIWRRPVPPPAVNDGTLEGEYRRVEPEVLPRRDDKQQ